MRSSGWQDSRGADVSSDSRYWQIMSAKMSMNKSKLVVLIVVALQVPLVVEYIRQRLLIRDIVIRIGLIVVVGNHER